MRVMGMECRYVIAGREEAPTTGTPHLQGFCCFTSVKSFKQVQKLLPSGCWLEAAKGSIKQNVDYCSKGGRHEVAGEKPDDNSEKQNKSKLAIEAQWELAKAGDFEKLPISLIKTAEYIHVKYGAVPSDRLVLDNKWIWGASGCGKSRHVRSTYDEFYSKPMSKWWDGYDGQPVVVLDDFDPSHGKFLGYFLKIWSDHYAFNAEVKGGMLKIRPLIVIVTSQYPIEDCFEEQQTIAAITRRFEVIKM